MKRQVSCALQQPGVLEPEERLSEIARVFAAGVLRLHKRGLLAAGPDRPMRENPPESGHQGLEVPGGRWLSVRAG